MTKDQFLEKMSQLNYIFKIDANISVLHDEQYWRSKHKIDGVVESLLRILVLSQHSELLLDFNDGDVADLLITTMFRNLDASDSDKYDMLYTKAVKIFESEYQRIGYMTEQDFIKWMFDLVNHFDLNESFEEVNLQEISTNYGVYFNTQPEKFRKIVLEYTKTHYIPWDDPDFWSISEFGNMNKSRGPMNQFDSAKYAMERFLTERGRKKDH